MLVARLYDYGDIRIEEEEIPQIGPGDALLKMGVCGICTSDTLPWYVRRKAPIVLGHEPAGTIQEVGPDVEGFRPGDRVFVHHHAPCMACRLCRRGHYSMCPTWKGSSLDPGGLAEYLRVPSLNLRTDTLKLPSDFSLEDGAFVEPTACAVQALKRRAKVESDDRVLIIGMGIMGQILALVCRDYGASQVIVADRVAYRLNKALELGADAAIDVTQDDLEEEVRRSTDGEMVDLVVVGPGSIDAMQSGIASVGVGGTVLFFTPTEPGEELSISPYDLYSADLTITTSYSCGPPDTRDALEIVGRGVVSAEKLVTHRFSLDRTVDGFLTVAEARDSIKTLIVINEEQS